MKGFFSRSGSCSENHAILMPVMTRKAPKMYRIQWNSLISQLPAKIMIVRSTMAPTMPYSSTRRCSSSGTAKKLKIIIHTKTLSTASDFSTR